jgi:hypothetical protein
LGQDRIKSAYKSEESKRQILTRTGSVSGDVLRDKIHEAPGKEIGSLKKSAAVSS